MATASKTTKKNETASKYYEAVGRRKSATARVRISESSKQAIIINGKDVKDYFAVENLQKLIVEPIVEAGLDNKFEISVKVLGSGLNGQAEAIRLGIARALVVFNEELKLNLSQKGFLKRDPRSKERKKFGLLKARKRPQWSKR